MSVITIHKTVHTCTTPVLRMRTTLKRLDSVVRFIKVFIAITKWKACPIYSQMNYTRCPKKDINIALPHILVVKISRFDQTYLYISKGFVCLWGKILFLQLFMTPATFNGQLKLVIPHYICNLWHDLFSVWQKNVESVAYLSSCLYKIIN